MGESFKARHLRQLLRTAQQLRQSAEGTTDAHYVRLFIRAAETVELRATEIANFPGDGWPDAEPDHVAEVMDPGMRINLLV